MTWPVIEVSSLPNTDEHRKTPINTEKCGEGTENTKEGCGSVPACGGLRARDAKNLGKHRKRQFGRPGFDHGAGWVFALLAIWL
jgi:hypothetical protein